MIALVTLSCGVAAIAGVNLEHFIIAPITDNYLVRYVCGTLAVFIPATVGSQFVTTPTDAAWVFWGTLVLAGLGTKGAYFISKIQDRLMAKRMAHDA